MALSQRSFAFLLLRVLAVTLAEPVQYCRFGHGHGQIDFCAAMVMHQNQSTSAHDLYLSMTVTRSSPLGWTAIGTGSVMAGSLMFIVYGDAESGQGPIVSIRTVPAGHAQPRPVDQDDTGPSDIRVVQSTWAAADGTHDDPTWQANIAVVCYACTRFPSAALSAAATSVPWIWAWNDKQRHSVYSVDAELDMHKHHAGNGGWGNFYVDMARSVSEGERPPSWPRVRPGIAMLGASDWPSGVASSASALDGNGNPLARLHGLFMATAFLFIFPLGVAAMRSGSAQSFKYHWALQLIGTAFAEAGAITGICMTGARVASTTRTHGPLGVSVAVLLLVQALAGWRHHVVFVRIRRRTWISHLHIWLGRVSLVASWVNLVSGLILAGAGRSRVAAMGCFIVLDALGLAIFLWLSKRSARTGSASATAASRDNVDKYFVLGTASDDEDGGEGGGGESRELQSVVTCPRFT
ncbi:hypothetical protein CDD83_2131 [Cordyceps sp. RAO-2017]|nr:hypothetical protein CDD83_2131 [Cordyceps sp. RAO-2017]